ncbi:hypothetical protein TTHERM_00051949 (macronuclear) [Tetrahymena thermophila SB210]|uniref:Uncharacterized protein n=1 Tax=Tetrahymena thermophila (strain SB210) TaxID=312017 RepID=A4VE11_TETTS|nr:hypothetical protein TTHERM_00051949 [Tetrahymena thermophila SB210]EDK31774.2 hypothetical protein TTHERM_00051949 [Tetrahymena thermophila SB210]|eukprot:XP_001471328.2 hypothetical protein TTHERM_00051949 [Tetrahymena thermophila SB210]
MDYGFYFRDIDNAQKLKQQKKDILEQANTIVDKEENFQEYLKQRWKICKGLFAVKYLEIHLELDNKFPENRYLQQTKKEQQLQLQLMKTDENYIRKLEKSLNKFLEYREQVTDEEIKTEILILDLVVLLFKIRLGIRKQNLPEIMALFDDYQMFIKEMMSFQHYGWIIIQSILIIFGMCRYQTEDFKGSAILFRKAIKLSTIMIQSDFFLEVFFSNPEKKMKLQIIIYDCEILLSKAIFEMTKCLKESIQLEQIILKIDSDAFLNAQQKQEIFEKFKKQYEKQRATIIKNGGQTKNTDSELGSVTNDKQFQRKDSQLNFQKLALEVSQKSNKFQQQSNSSQKKKIAFLISQKNNEKWFKNAMQSNNIQTNTPVFHQNSKQSLSRGTTQSLSRGGSLANQSPTQKKENPFTLQVPSQNNSQLNNSFSKQIKPQVKSMLLQTVSNLMSKKKSILQSPANLEIQSPNPNLAARRSMARQSILVGNTNIKQYLANIEAQKNSPGNIKQREGPYEIDDEDIENLGNNLSELSITLPHDNQSFMDRFTDQQQEDKKYEKIRSLNFQNNMIIQKDILVERINLFKKLKGGAKLFSDYNLEDQIQDKQRLEIEQSLGKEVKERFKQNLVPIYKETQQQQSKQPSEQIMEQSQQSQQFQIKIVSHHKKAKSMQFSDAQHFSSTQLSMNLQQQQQPKTNNYKSSQQINSQEKLSQHNLSQDKKIKSMTSLKGHHHHRVQSAQLHSGGKTQNNLFQNTQNQQMNEQQKLQPVFQHQLAIPLQIQIKNQNQNPYYSQSAQISPQSNKNVQKSNISILSPQNKNSISMNKMNIYNYQNFMKTSQEQKFSNIKQQNGSASKQSIINQINSSSSKKQIKQNSPVTSMEFIQDYNGNIGYKQQKNSLSNIHSPEMSSFSTERTNDSRVYKSATGKNQKKLSNIIGIDQANSIMNARPKWDLSSASSTKYEESISQKMKKPKSTLNLIDQIIGQSQIIMENQYANPSDIHTPFPFIQYALKNVEKERILQQLIQKSQTIGLVPENQKNFVKEVVQKKRATPKHLEQDEVEKLQQNIRREILNQQSKIEEEITKTDIDKIEESFNKYLLDKQKGICMELEQERERLKAQEAQGQVQNERKLKNSQSIGLENLKKQQSIKDDSIKISTHFQNQSKNEISHQQLSNQDSIVGEEKFLEMQDISRKQKRDDGGLKELMDTEESQDVLYQIEQSKYSNNQSEYLDKVDILEDDEDEVLSQSSSELTHKKTKKKPISMIFQENSDNDAFASENILKQFENMKKNKFSGQDSLEDLSDEDINQKKQKTFKQPSFAEIQSQMARGKIKIRKQKALSQSQIQFIMNEDQKTMFQIIDEDNKQVNLEKNHPSFEFTFYHPFKIDKIKIQLKATPNPDKTFTYFLTFLGYNINDSMKIDFNFIGNSNVKNLMDQYTIWPLVLESIKKQLAFQGLEEMINDKTIHEGQYLITDQNLQKLEDHDQTLNDLHDWKEKIARTNIGSQSLAQKKLKGHSQSENIQFTKDGQARVLKRQSTYFMRTKYKMNYFCNLDKEEYKYLNEKDIKSIGSIKNLLNNYFLSCYEHSYRISGKQLIRKIEQEDINFIQAQKTIHEIFNLQKKISRMSARQCIIPYVCDNVEQGTSIRIILHKKEDESKVNTSHSQRSVSLLDQSLVLTKRDKIFLSYWIKNQQNHNKKEQELKIKLSELLVQKRDDVICFLSKRLQQKSYIGTLIKKQYLFNSYFYIHIYLSHNKIKDINLVSTIDKYCKIKELPFIILVDAVNVDSQEKIIPLELPIETLIGIFPRDEILTSITQLLLTGQIQKNFKRKLMPFIEEKIFIMLSTNNQRQRQGYYSMKSSQTTQTKQQKVAFQTAKFDEFSQLHMDPSLIYQDLPRIFSEKIKQQIEPTIYEKLFEKLFNEVYEKDFINRRNVDVDAIFQNISQQNNVLKQNALQEGEIEMQSQQQINTQQQMLSLNNSFTNTNLIDQASNLDESLQYQFGTNNFEDVDKQNPTFSANPISRKQLTQLSNNYSNLLNNNKFLNITKNVKNEVKQLEKHRKRIIKNIKLIQDIQNNILAQPNISINNISLDSSFVSTNNLQGSFYQNDQNIQLNNIYKQEQVLDKLYRQLRKADYQMDWQVYGLFGRFLIYVNELGKINFKINNFLPKLELTFDQITNKQQNIIINILSYAVNLRYEEQKPIQNTKTMLRYMLQNMVQKDFRSLTSFRFFPRKPSEYGTQQLILSNNSSVQYHLNLQTKEFLSQYSNIKQTFAYGLKNIGRSLVVGFSFTSNLDISSSKYSILLSINVMPLLSKTIMYKTILSLQDLSILDPQNSVRIVSSKMASSIVMSTFKSILKKSVFINTQIGRLPVFHYSQTTYLFQINTPSTSKRLFKTQVYEGKKLSGIYSRNNQRLRSLQNNQNFEEASEAAFNSSVQGDEEMFQWNNHLNQLRIFRNSMIKLNFDQKVAEKQTQNFLNEDIVRYRFIFSISKVFQNEYILVSVFRDLLQQNWLIKFYFPRNCRYLQCHLDSSDLFQSSSKFLKKTISNQILWLSHENEYQDIFQSYLDFQKRLNLKGLSDSSQIQQQNETFIQSPVFLNKKRGTLHLSKHDLKKYSIIQASNANNPANERRNMSYVFQKSPFSSRSPSPTKRSEISPNSYKNEYQQSPQGNNVILSKFFVQKKAAETVKNKSDKMKMKSSTHKNQKKSIIQNEPTVDSQYDMTSKSIGIKTGGFQDYLRSYIQTERQIPLKKRQLSGIFNGSHGSLNNIGSERALYVQRNDININNSFNEENEKVKNRSINNLPYIIPSNSSLEQQEKKQSHQTRTSNHIVFEEQFKEKEHDQSQNLIRSKMEKIQTTQENQTESRSGEIKETSQKSISSSQKIKEKEEQKENVIQKKKNLRDIVHKHLKSVKIINSVKSIVEYLKPKRNDKINRIERLKNMTLIQDQSFIDTIKQFDMSKNIRLRKQQQHFKLKQEKNDRYYELKIWENIINYSNLRLTCLQLDLGGEGINLKEILISKYLRVDKTSENFFEISIDLLEVLQQKNMQIQMQNNGGQNQNFEINFKNIVTQHIEQQLNQKAKKKQEAIQEGIKEEQLKNNQSSKKDSTKDNKEQTFRKVRENPNRSMTFVKNFTGIDYFYPIEYIQYAATSAFNFTISHMNLNQATFQDIYLNCREITNVFIAEGYFKYQANYIYSNINYADFCNLAQFILYKICNSNFLEMLYDKSEQKRIKKEDLNRFKVNNIPKKYNKKNIRFINPQNIQFMHTKIVNPFKRTYIRTLISTHDMTFNLEMFQISTKNSIKITKSFIKMIKKIPFLRQHFEMGEIFYVLRHITDYYEQQLTIAWSLKYV